MTAEAIKSVRFFVSLSSEAFLEYYRGPGRTVLVQTADGQRLQFPAGILQRFVTHEGVHGHFVVRYDQSNRLIDITRV